MKKTHNNIRSFVRRSVLLLFATLIPQLTTVFGQTTAFTYQGQLTENGNPANGTYDLRFELFNAVTLGTPQGSPVTNLAVAVSGGLFTVTLDFGNQFPGADRWLEIASRTNGVGAFGTLTPRQQITSTPYAIMALNTATNAGTLSAGQITSGTLADARIDSALARDAEVAAAYQPLDPDLTDLADGSLTGSKVGTGINAGNITTGTLGDGLLTGNVALLDRNPQTFTGTNIFNTRVGIGESSPLALLHVQESDIGVTAAALGLDTVVVESSDAILGLFSNNSGGFGSGIAFKEVVSGGFSNAWGIVRRTTQNSPELRLTFGTSANITGNPTLFAFSTNGNMTVLTGSLGVGLNSPTNDLHVVGGATVTGNVLAGGLTVGGGTNVNRILSTTASINFLNTGAQSSSQTTVTLTGAALGDAVFLGVPDAATPSGTSYSAWVSSANTVTVRFLNATTSAVDPAVGTFRVAIIQF